MASTFSFYDMYTTSKGSSRPPEEQERLQKKYALLTHLRIPLGDHADDNKHRTAILSELLSFQEEHGGAAASASASSQQNLSSINANQTTTGSTSAAINAHGAVKIVTGNNARVQHIVRIPCFTLPPHGNVNGNGGTSTKARGPKEMQFLDTIMDCVFRSNSKQATKLLSADAAAEVVRDASARLILHYMARYYNQQFVEHTEMAENIAKRNRKRLHPPNNAQIPHDVVIHDGTNPEHEINVRWNSMYQRLLDYHAKYGDCLVCSEPPSKKQGREYDDELLRWVSSQRTNYKHKAPSLSSKRIQLMEEIGFVWSVTAHFFNAVESVEYHKALAAKLCFGITAVDAMVIAGFSMEDASHDSRKKSFNSNACNLYKKNNAKGITRIRPLVEPWLEKLYQTPEDDLLDVLKEMYGESEFLDELYQAEKLVRNPLHPSKRRRTDETITNDGKSYVCPKRPESLSLTRSCT
jgi:hypothetical protein